MEKIKVLVEGMKPTYWGRERYIMTQYECINANIIQYDFVFTSYKPFPEKYRMQIEKQGGGEYILPEN